LKKLLIVLAVLFVFIVAVSAAVVLLERGSIPIGEKVAVLRIEGPIIDSKDWIEELKEYVEDPSVKAIVLRVDSPGGAVAPSQEIFAEVKKAAEKKKVVASMGSVAASGGYYVQLPSARSVANPGTLTGSIGVIMEIPNIEGLMDKVGVKTQVIKSGKHKDMASLFREMGEEERGILQGVLDDVHEQFVNAVAESRKMPLEEARRLADGRIYTGSQAVKAGLVDELGTLEDAIDIAAKMAGIKGEPEVISKKKDLSFFDLLRGKMSAGLPELFPHLKIKYMLSP
jgi:protease-4